VGSQVVKGDIRQWLTYMETGALIHRKCSPPTFHDTCHPTWFKVTVVGSCFSVAGHGFRGYISDISLIFIDICRSRHRFTAAYLDILISNSFRLPHKTMDEYILHLKGHLIPRISRGPNPNSAKNSLPTYKNYPLLTWRKLLKVR
jgi:hypothetical protein